jgi:hypothetical protein
MYDGNGDHVQLPYRRSPVVPELPADGNNLGKLHLW